MSQLKFGSRFGFSVLSAGAVVALLGLILGPARTQAALVDGGNGPQLLIGFDDDNQANALIQAGAVANQSLNRTDILDGGRANDVMFGLNGNDVMDGGPGDDIILGGPDGGAAPGGPPNSDIMFGGPGNDVNLWAPGDGSEAFIGGPGLDAIIFGATDREAVADPSTGVRFRPCSLVFLDFPKASPLRM
jgi:Ca2+-binding RTX toxin-like protein